MVSRCVTVRDSTFAVHRDGAFGRFRDLDEPVHDKVGRHGAVHEEQLAVFEPVRCELPRVVRLLVQSHDRRYIVPGDKI